MDSEQRKVFYLLLLYMLGLSAGEGSFEDADKANDFLSQSHQHYDLRHTIPGEPDIDYPIYSAVPKTSFSCAQKHEGYYADIESRCQAFRICTNTARNTAGFGFLCPNGTLFSQRHFVCDWYRNVRCEESEQFFNKNAHNRISNHYEMMETVRQMIEYPMKTISKALAQKQVHTKLQAPRSYATNQQVKAAPKPTVVSLTASQVAPSYGTTLLRPIMPTTPKLLLSESRPTLSNTNPKRTQEVYVNSFGELSTDPGSKFDPKTARIIAKPEKPGSSFNFAESINFGLNEYFPAMNRNQKNIGNVDSNLNILRHEIQADVSAKKSVHRSTSSQEASASSNFISHGFSKSKKDYVKSTHYQFPKQTANTAKFSSNDISTDTHKQNYINTQNNQDVEFQFMKTTPSTPVTVDSFLINSFFDIPYEPLADDFDTTNADDVEELFFQDNSEKKTNDDDVIQIHFTSSTETPTITTTAQPITTTTTELFETTTATTTPETTTVEALPTNKESSKQMKLQALVEKANQYDDSSYLTNLNLLENLVDDEVVTPKTTTTNATTTTMRPETDLMQTSTEMMMSVKSVETHVRSHRRPHSSRNHHSKTTNLAKPKIHHRRTHLRANMSTTTTATTTTAKPNERTTIIKERRQHHSHHAHQSRHRARTTTTTTTTVAPHQALNLETVVSENNTSSKLNVRRNIDSSSVARGNNLSTEKNTKANVRYGSINQQRRRTTSTTSTTTKPTNSRSRQNIIRSRGSQTYQRVSRTTSTSTTTTTTTTKKPANNVEHLIGKTIEIIPFNVSLINNSMSTTTSTTPTTLSPITTVSSSTTSIAKLSDIHTNQTDTLHNEIDAPLLPFNELTRAIVDESILQSYRNNQQTQYKQTIPLVPILPTTTTTNSYSNNQAIKPAEPNIVIARAEGQRIGSTSHAAFVPQQNKVSKVSSGTSYESLNEFLHKKFGQTKATTAKPATRYYNTLPQRTSAAQEPTKHIVYAQPAQQQQLYTHRTVFSNLQQQQQPLQHHPQQPQLTFFNNNNNQLTLNSQAHNYRQVQQTGAYRNFKLPTVNDGIIPAAYTQVAQRRLDTFNFELETSTSTSPRMKLFSGVSSYDVPLSSVGRLPNDISQRLRRL